MLKMTIVFSLFLQFKHGEVKQTLYWGTNAPDRFDWRDFDVITPVSDQGLEGRALDIVIAEGVESLHAIQTTTKAVLLSRHEVADCCDSPGQTGKPPLFGFDCIASIGGLCTESDYRNGTRSCQNATCTPVGKVTGAGYIPTGSEDDMKKTIYSTPLVAGIDASLKSFQTYTSGIYSDTRCSSAQLNHVVQIVGFGSEAETDYWIIKNSWGVSWGEKGYMKIQRDFNMCGIATRVFYPVNEYSHFIH